MKKQISVLGFYVRSSIYKVLLVLFVMALAELVVFVIGLNGALTEYYELSELYTGENSAVAQLARPEILFGRQRLSWIFTAAVVAVSMILCIPGCEFGTKAGYTIKRLQVSERACFFWHVFCSLMLFLLVYAVQLGVAWGLGLYYVEQVPKELVGNQSIFLMFYRSEFLHSLLPLADIRIWIRNLLLLFGFSFAAAGFSYQQRRKKKPMMIFLMLVFSVFFFSQETAGFANAFALGLMSMCVVAKMLFTVLSDDEELL